MKQGKQINTLDELMWAAHDKKSVTVPKNRVFNGAHPAEGMILLSAGFVAQLLKLGIFKCIEGK